MFCQKCGAEVTGEFCGQCGTRVGEGRGSGVKPEILYRCLEGTGIAVAMLGMFLPFYRISFLGTTFSVSYIEGDGIITTFLLIAAFVLSFFKYQKISAIFCGLAVSLPIYDMCSIFAEAEGIGEVGAGIYITILGLAIFGAGVGYAIKNRIYRKAPIEPMSLKKKIAISIAAFIGAVMVTLLFIFGIIPEIEKSKAYDEAAELMENGEYDKAAVEFSRLEDYKDSGDKVIDCKYAYALELMQNESYEEAKILFAELKDYEDSEENMKVCMYLDAVKSMAESGVEDEHELHYLAQHPEKLENVISKFEALEELGGYEDSAQCLEALKYVKAQTFIINRQYEEAISILEGIMDYDEEVAEWIAILQNNLDMQADNIDEWEESQMPSEEEYWDDDLGIGDNSYNWDDDSDVGDVDSYMWSDNQTEDIGDYMWDDDADMDHTSDIGDVGDYMWEGEEDSYDEW